MKMSERNLRRFIQSVIMENAQAPNIKITDTTAVEVLELLGISHANEFVSENQELDLGGVANTGLKVTGTALKYSGAAFIVAGIATYLTAKSGMPIDVEGINQIISALNTPEGQKHLAGLFMLGGGAAAAMAGDLMTGVTTELK